MSPSVAWTAVAVFGCLAWAVALGTRGPGALQRTSALPIREEESLTTVTLNFTEAVARSRTAANIEVDVMPLLGHNETSQFEAYTRALGVLREHAMSYIRFSPWFGYPRVVVAELDESGVDCSGPGGADAVWNTALLDGVMRDFYVTVCGPGAAAGECPTGVTVAQQFSTMPSWMFVNGVSSKDVPENPWEYPSGNFYYYISGAPLRDPTCREMAHYAARLVAWYTAGGTVDACGVYRPSGLHYPITAISVLNENEHALGPKQYATCFYAWQVGMCNRL